MEFLSKSDFVRKTCAGELQKASWWWRGKPQFFPLEQGIGVKFKTDANHILCVVKDFFSQCDYIKHGSFFGDYFLFDITDYKWTLWVAGGYDGYNVIDCSLLDEGQFYSVPYGSDAPYRYVKPEGVHLIEQEECGDACSKVEEIIFKLDPLYIDDEKITFYITRDLTYWLDSGYIYEIIVTAEHKKSFEMDYTEFLRLSPVWRIYMRPFSLGNLAFCYDSPREWQDFYENVIPQRGL